MAEIKLNQNRIHAVVSIATRAVAEHVKGVESIEALIGFAEVTGRVIAAQEGTPLLHNDMLKLAIEHMTKTVRASYSADGRSWEPQE